MLNFLRFKPNPKINEKSIKDLNIPIINYSDIKIDKNPICTTGSGIFYKANYKDEVYTIKIIDITKDEKVINEFILWEKFKEYENFLNLKGVCIKGDEAYLLFEFFAFSLETALKQNLITEDNRTDIVKQCMNIITILQSENKKTSDIRPGVFGINDKICIKLLDFGNEITEKKMFNNDKIVKERMKYQPPEYFVFNGDDLNYDLWSFGCLLIDMYSTECPIYDMEITQDELSKNICNGNFPKIPNDISPLLQNLIKRCLERDYIKRINIEELANNMKIFFENEIQNYQNELNQISEFDIDNKLKDCFDFAKRMDNTMSTSSSMINSVYLNEINDLLDSVNNCYDNCMCNLENNFKNCLNNLQKIYEENKIILNSFKEKCTNKILIMKEYFQVALIEIGKTKKISDEVKRGIRSLNKFQNLDNYDYNSVVESFETQIEKMKENIVRFSEQVPFDKIGKENSNNEENVNLFKKVVLNECLTLQNCFDLLFYNKTNFLNDNNVYKLGNKLGIYDEINFEFNQNNKQDENNNNIENNEIIQIKKLQI
jgi:serine/threonine protein kinase